MKPLEYIIVGVGGWGGYWCREVLLPLAYSGKAVAVAAVDRDPEALKRSQEFLMLPSDRLYTDMASAFANHRADFAIVVVPPAFHESVVDIALAHDLHILSEKPIADSMDACARIYHKVRSSGKKMIVTMSHRFDRDKQTLEALIKGGDYGPLNYVICRFTNNCRKFGSWGEFRHRIPDPLLIEGTVHHFDIFRSLCGADAQTVYAKTWNPTWGEFAGDSTAMITMEMTNGAKCFYEGAKANASTMNGWTQEYFRAECRDATLEMDRRRIRLLRSRDLGPETTDVELLQRPTWMNPWLAEQFCDWLNGGPEPATRLEDNIQCCALLFAAVESAHSGSPVDVQEYLRNSLGT